MIRILLLLHLTIVFLSCKSDEPNSIKKIANDNDVTVQNGYELPVEPEQKSTAQSVGKSHFVESKLPYFRSRQGYFIAKDPEITKMLLDYEQDSLPKFGDQITVAGMLRKDTVNGQIFNWLKIEEHNKKIPSLFLSHFEFPYVGEGRDIRRIQSDGKVRGGRSGIYVDLPDAISNFFLYMRDTIGWQRNKGFMSLSDFDGESGWIKKGVRISSDSLSFYAAVQLFFHIAHPYHKDFELRKNYLFNDVVNIWYATFEIPQFNTEGFCRVIERNGFVQILAEYIMAEEAFSYDEWTNLIEEVISKGDYNSNEWKEIISGDGHFEVILSTIKN